MTQVKRRCPWCKKEKPLGYFTSAIGPCRACKQEQFKRGENFKAQREEDIHLDLIGPRRRGRRG